MTATNPGAVGGHSTMEIALSARADTSTVANPSCRPEDKSIDCWGSLSLDLPDFGGLSVTGFQVHRVAVGDISCGDDEEEGGCGDEGGMVAAAVADTEDQAVQAQVNGVAKLVDPGDSGLAPGTKVQVKMTLTDNGPTPYGDLADVQVNRWVEGSAKPLIYDTGEQTIQQVVIGVAPAPKPPTPSVPVHSVTVSPPSQSGTAGGTAGVTAVVTSDGIPQAGAPVDFVITSGPDAGKVEHTQTDTNGQAHFTWNSSGAGTDTVIARTTFLNASRQTVTTIGSGTASWAAKPPAPASPPPTAPAGSGPTGYVMAEANGGVFTFGTAFQGSAAGIELAAPVVGVARTPSGNGYWLVAADGGVFAYGNARFYGSAANIKLAAPVVGVARTPSGNGYWLVAADGGVFAYGDARFYGSTANIKVSAPVVDIVSTGTGQGYWLMARDGRVFTFGNAVFHGSIAAGGSPIVSAGATNGNGGYWTVAADGHVYSFGDAPRMPGVANLHAPIVAMDATPTGKGYVMVGADGGVFNYGDSVFAGSAANLPLIAPIVAIADK